LKISWRKIPNVALTSDDKFSFLGGHKTMSNLWLTNFQDGRMEKLFLFVDFPVFVPMLIAIVARSAEVAVVAKANVLFFVEKWLVGPSTYLDE